MNKCTKKNCPMNAETLNPDCNLKGCPYRTEMADKEMTVDEYRNRLKKSFVKCKCGEFIPLIAEPTNEGFDKLERFLINFYRNPNEHSTTMCIALGMVLMDSYKNNKACVEDKKWD